LVPDSGLPDSQVPDDHDGDGYPAANDCDDNDDQVYPGVARDCSSDCGTGTETCLEATGTWSECTAPTDCNCATPGETRLVNCGNCGQQSQRCGTDLIWANQGDCINEGVCSPGQQDQQSCQFCGSGVRLCQNDCQWGPPDCSGVCVPGTAENTSDGCTNPWEVQSRLCDAQCAWTTVEPCSGQCLLTPRQNDPDHKTEICVPGGEFIMGRQLGQGQGNDEPAHTVALTPYFIDKYEVTNARYAECVNAGVCAQPVPPADYYETGSESRPVVKVTHSMAGDFCLWDGGRSLPTEAQWEKAARGPAPREVLNPWGSATATCDLCAADDCRPFGEFHAFEVGLHPLGASYYGIHNLAGNVGEWCSDWYSPTYYATSPSLDPQGPAAGTRRVSRSFDYSDELSEFIETVTFRINQDPTANNHITGFRCARAGF
jgi:formylglycine-generating enzyme required for sulfatase activity